MIALFTDQAGQIVWVHFVAGTTQLFSAAHCFSHIVFWFDFLIFGSLSVSL